MKNLDKTFDDLFKQAYSYASKVVFSLKADGIDCEDLLQNFSLTVLANKDKYAQVINSKRGVYLTLEGLRNNELRKLSVRNREGNAHRIDSSLLASAINSPDDINLLDKSRDYIESILYQIFKPNGRKNSVHSYSEQVDLVKEYKSSNLSTRAYCKTKGISTGTLHRLLKFGPKKPPTPKTITAFLDRYFNNLSVTEIADKLNITNGAVNQLLYESRNRIKQYFESEEENYYAAINEYSGIEDSYQFESEYTYS